MTLPTSYQTDHELSYLRGFRAALQSEARDGALPQDQNSPRNAPYGLHPEQLNGTGFTAKRAHNQRVWMYRIRPSVLQTAFEAYADNPRFTGDFSEGVVTAELLRWKPTPMNDGDFVDGLTTIAGIGSPALRNGLAMHAYTATKSMDRAFYNADGDLLITPEEGSLRVRTELGLLDVAPGQALLIPKGIKFAVGLHDAQARGFVLEVFSGPFELPERGPIGANGLADARHFEAPVAAFEDTQNATTLIAKLGGSLWQAQLDHSPFDVVAWHGNHVPYRYDLRHFNSQGSVSFDHTDPSIFTVLTVPFDAHGNNVADFVAFTGRWDVAEHSFRPPYFHRNVATEFNAVIKTAGAGNGFAKGVSFYTPSLTGHGVAASSVKSHLERSDDQADKPVRIPDRSVWIMFESIFQLKVMPWMLDAEHRDRDFRAIYEGMPVPYK